MSNAPKLGCLGTIALIIFFGMVINATKDCGGGKKKSEPTAKLVPQTFGEKVTTDQKEKPQLQERTSAEILALAKNALNYKDKNNYPYGRLTEAEGHLYQIRSGDKEYAEAQKLLVEVEKRKKLEKKDEEKRLKELVIFQRKAYGNQLEKLLLGKGMDFEVYVSGRENTILKLKYVLMSRPMIYKIVEESNIMKMLKEMGFKKVIFTDGYNSTWTYDLTK